LALVILLAACASNDATKTATKGDELLAVTFDAPRSWEEGSYAGDTEATLAIIDGRYQIDYRAGRSPSFVWGVGGDAYENVIVEVETEQLSATQDNLYGVICRLRLDDRGDPTGYALLISGDGHYGIAEITSDSLTFLLDWRQSAAVRQGRAMNTIRAVCADDYLAIYVNDKFMGEVKNETFRRAGQVALIAGVTGGAEVSVAFDNLAVYEGAIH
jgi:hypothetical protein